MSSVDVERSFDHVTDSGGSDHAEPVIGTLLHGASLMSYEPPLRITVPMPNHAPLPPSTMSRLSPSEAASTTAHIYRPLAFPRNPHSPSKPKPKSARRPPTIQKAPVTQHHSHMPAPPIAAPALSSTTTPSSPSRSHATTTSPRGDTGAPQNAQLTTPPSNKKKIVPVFRAIAAGGTVVHQHERTATVDTPLAWFALSVPRCAIGHFQDRKAQKEQIFNHQDIEHVESPPSALPKKLQWSSRDVSEGAVKGWVEPGPRSLQFWSRNVLEPLNPPVLGKSGAGAVVSMEQALLETDLMGRTRPRHTTADVVVSVARLPLRALQHVFLFLDADTLDDVVVHVHRIWYFAVSQSPVLSKSRLSFRYRGEKDGRGVMCYLASKQTGGRATMFGPPSAVMVAANPHVFNPSMSMGSQHTFVRVKTISSTVYNPLTTSSPMRNGSDRRDTRGGTTDERLLTSFGPSSFTTPSIPYAWVGIALKHGFQLDVTAYTFSISNGYSAAPMSWELQGCAESDSDSDDDNDSCKLKLDSRPFKPEGSWKLAQWHVLHSHQHAVDHVLQATASRSVAPMTPSNVSSASLSTSFASATAASASGRTSSVAMPTTPEPISRQPIASGQPFANGRRTEIFQIPVGPASGWGPCKRLRIVQTDRNSEWGHALSISGLEFYGYLSRSASNKSQGKRAWL